MYSRPTGENTWSVLCCVNLTDDMAATTLERIPSNVRLSPKYELQLHVFYEFAILFEFSIICGRILENQPFCRT